MIWMPNREPPLDPPEPEVAFRCDYCGNDIYVGEEYYHIDGTDICTECLRDWADEFYKREAEPDGPDPDLGRDDW